MNQQPQQRISHLISTLQRYFPLLIVPAIAGLVLAMFYAFFLMPETWTARQSFLIRDDLSGTAFKPGRFDSEESRKSAQETILEVARRPLVVRNVLEKLGSESMLSGGSWITDEVIEDTQKEIDISAPNGAEFGKTDAIVLTAKASTRERTRKFIELLSEEIITQTNRIRSLRFESMESELYQAYQSAEQARTDAIDRLEKLDQRLGSDFGFLSVQAGQPSGVEAIKSEILRKQDELEKAEAVFAALLKAFENPADVAQLPSAVLVAQPTLEKTMSKMIDLREQLHLAKGLFSSRHARVRALVKAIEFSKKQLYDSLTGEMAGVQGGIALKKRQLARLNNRIEELKARHIRLSKSRSEHLALSTQVTQLGETANRTKTEWSETKSRARTARTVGLITPTDVAQVNSRPDGIGKKAVALAGLLGGLLVGMGLVLLVAPPMETQSTNQVSSNPVSNTTVLQSADRPTQPGQVPQHRTSTTSGNSGGAFQHAASAMQSAADAMRMAASNETKVENVVPVAQPQPASEVQAQSRVNQTDNTIASQVRPAANTTQSTANEAARRAFQSQSPSMPPRDARAQPVTKQADTTKQKQRSAPKPNPFKSEQPTAEPDQMLARKVAAAQAKALESSRTGPADANVRPVDLAKSASVNNEFVRVNEASDAAHDSSTYQASKADTLPAGKPQTETKSSVSKSAQAIAATIAATKTSARDVAATIVLTDDEKDDSQQAVKQRQQVGSEAFVIKPNGETSQSPTDIDQNLIDAIPDQIRKLSDSILNFGKDKK